VTWNPGSHVRHWVLDRRRQWWPHVAIAPIQSVPPFPRSACLPARAMFAGLQWRGVLVEGSTTGFESLRAARPDAIVVNTAVRACGHNNTCRCAEVGARAAHDRAAMQALQLPLCADACCVGVCSPWSQVCNSTQPVLYQDNGGVWTDGIHALKPTLLEKARADGQKRCLHCTRLADVLAHIKVSAG
jgi:hypothetical protein